MGNKSCSPKLYHSLSFMHKKNPIIVDTVQLVRTVSKKLNYKSQETILLYLGTFLDPGTMDQVFDGLDLCSCYGKCWCLCAEF